MREEKIGPFTAIISEIVPENKVLFVHPNCVEQLKKDIKRWEPMKKKREKREEQYRLLFNKRQ